MPTNPPDHHPPEASPYAAHIPALDGIRGLAVLGVMSSHLFPGTARSALTRFIGSTLLFGASGVDLFFVLSGFLITGILFDSRSHPHYFKNFYARRVLRIFPLYYLVLLGYTTGALFFGMHFNRQLWSLALYLQNTHLITRAIYDYNGPSVLPLSQFWSLAVEEQFYLIWPLLVFLVDSRRQLLAVCLGFTIVCPLLRIFLWTRGWTYFPVQTSTLTRADSLLAGAALALLLRGPARDRILHAARWLLLVAAAVVILSTWKLDVLASLQALRPAAALSFQFTARDLLFTALLALVLTPSKITDLCRLPWLRSLGKYSYGLYVVHLPIFEYLQSPMKRLITMHITSSKGTAVGLTGIACFLFSLAVAWVSFRVYEQPFLRLKRFFSYRRPSPRVTIVA